MNIKEFKAGNWRKAFKYNYFLPNKINHSFVWDDATINELLEKSSLKLGELNAFARFIPNVGMFIKMHVMKEAVVSSKIEGTQTDMGEAFMDKKEIDPEKRDDWQEVNNYSNAMDAAIRRLNDLPLSNRMLKEAHETLMDNARGSFKSPGEFRTSQNWIGGSGISDAIFVPPLEHEISELMSDLELFLHNDKIKVPHLIKIAIAHYQFETIHPFLDGNGRLGRLMISLYLVSNSVMDKPLLYLSDFFERNRAKYYGNLMDVRLKNDLRQWLIFFLTAVVETSEKAIHTLKKIIDLREETQLQITKLGRRADSASTLLNHLYGNPVILIRQVEEICSLSPKAAGDLINALVELKILKELPTARKRNRIYVFQEYLNLFDGLS